jgi:hypothetical protein
MSGIYGYAFADSWIPDSTLLYRMAELLSHRHWNKTKSVRFGGSRGGSARFVRRIIKFNQRVLTS